MFRKTKMFTALLTLSLIIGLSTSYGYDADSAKPASPQTYSLADILSARFSLQSKLLETDKKAEMCSGYGGSCIFDYNCCPALKCSMGYCR